MKTRLTKKQTIHLIKLGVPVGKASEQIYEEINDTGRFFRQPTFTLDDLLDLLPKEIERPKEEKVLHDSANLVIHGLDGEWAVEYEYIDGKLGSYFQAGELIDALYSAVLWYYGEYLKQEKK